MASRLNLAALRGLSGGTGVLEAVQPSLGGVPFPPPIPRPGTLGVVRRPGSIGFTLNGSLGWLIDVRRFAGAPTLTVRSIAHGGTRITLTGARFPGTDLSADFVCVLGSTLPIGTPMDLQFTLGGFHGQVIIERWLAGDQVMESTVHVGGDVCPLGVTSKLAIAGDAHARFFPNWFMQMGAAGLATLTGLGGDLASDTFDLKLLFPGEPTISALPKTRRTRLTLFASAPTWDLTLQGTSLPIGRLTAPAGLFDAIEIEAGEGAAGDVARELVATSSRTDGLSLGVAGVITTLDGAPFTLALAYPTYAIAFDVTADHSKGDQTFLTARVAPPPTLCAADGCVMLLGDPNGPPPFESDALNGVVTAFRCEPALLSAAAPLSGHGGEELAAQPLPITSGARLPFVSAPGATPGWGVVAGPGAPGRRHLSLPDFSVSIVRREDLLSLEFRFYNLALEAGGGIAPQLVCKDTSLPAYLVVVFDAPQNIAEQAYLEAYTDPPGHTPSGTTTDEVPGSPSFPLPARTLAAGPSRLAFQFPAGVNALLYSLDSLLDWVKLEPSVAPVAQLSDTEQIIPPPTIREPVPTETAIEAPWHLVLSPGPNAAWAHSASAVTLDTRTELWHTRLAVRDHDSRGNPVPNESAERRIRAIWSPDYTPGLFPPHYDPAHPVDPRNPFRMSLDRNDRDQIVRLSSDATIRNYWPQSIPAEKLFLTSLGAWMDLFGTWPDPLPRAGRQLFSAEQWQHRAAMARDNYVRVVTAGFLLPFGHRASLIKVTERKLQAINGGPTTAFLRQRFFILVREPEKDYAALSLAQQRAIPFQRVRITTLVTPNLVPATDGGGHYSFFPMVGGQFFQFHLIGTDADGQTSEFAEPLYFVERGGDYSFAHDQYNVSTVRTPRMHGQKIAYAPSGTPGDTTLHTTDITFSAAPPLAAEPNFYPSMDGADVIVPAIQQVSGGSGAISIEYYPPYLAAGLGPGEVFARKTGGTLPVQFQGNQSGGVATPNLTVSGLSRKFGTVSGTTPDNVANGNYQPADIFNDPDAKLFGCIPLAELIDALAGGEASAPILQTQRLPDGIQTTLEFNPHAKGFDGGFVTLGFNGNAATALSLKATILTKLSGAPPEITIHGELNDFTLSLANVVGITISKFAFDAPAGQKMNVTVEMPDSSDTGPLMFLGDLSFLNTLRKFIPSNGFQDPPSLDITSEGITAGYSLPIPSIGVGVFSLENIRLSAALVLPFVASTPLRFRFAFCEREHPFLITVSLLGGGGFFGLEVGPDGVEMLEASIEVGANVSIDVVVASGNVHIMAGVYLKLDFVHKASQLTGYLRAGGSLDVLGLISASVEFYLGFTYFFGPECEIAGEATVTIEVHVLFFSASVSASLRRQFADPTVSFQDLIDTQQVWDDYCDAFAA